MRTRSQSSPTPLGRPGADALANRLEVARADGVALLALTIDERAIILALSRTRPKDSASYAPCS
jgi:hypothetical protein